MKMPTPTLALLDSHSARYMVGIKTYKNTIEQLELADRCNTVQLRVEDEVRIVSHW